MPNTKIFLSSITAITLIIPALADNEQPNIAVGTNPAACNESVLETTSGTSNLQAEWTPNTLNIDWYNGETKLTSNTCTYGSGITVPLTNPTKTGYTFAGWKVKTAAVANILASLNISIYGEDYGYINDSRGENGARSSNADTYGLTEDNTWATEFSYGTVYGEASCVASLDADMAYLLRNTDAVLEGEMSAETFLTEYTQLAGQEKAGILQDIYTRILSGAINENKGWYEVQAKLLSSDDNTRYNKTTTGQYCFCKATGYTPLNGTKQNVAASRWVLERNISAADCANYCAYNCAYRVLYDAGLRGAVFGVTE